MYFPHINIALVEHHNEGNKEGNEHSAEVDIPEKES
jgi:hypothetical protein